MEGAGSIKLSLEESGGGVRWRFAANRASERERQRASASECLRGWKNWAVQKGYFFVQTLLWKKKTRLQMVVDFLVIGGFDDVRGV